MKYMKITIYTDGSSRGNPGPGGWGAIILVESRKLKVESENTEVDTSHDEVIELGGREDMTTNNRMELLGAIKGLQEVEGVGVESVEVCTDSQYVKKGMTEWIDGWIKRGWKGSTKKPVLNQDLWEALKHEEDRLKKMSVKVTWKYVPAHVGVVMNERADTIATACADASNLQLYRGSKKDYTP